MCLDSKIAHSFTKHLSYCFLSANKCVQTNQRLNNSGGHIAITFHALPPTERAVEVL